ncbi:MAG: OmpA family protein [Bacteroidota bacterium]|nr:OmpA family protein [Bacteroidota bacterium]
MRALFLIGWIFVCTSFSYAQGDYVAPKIPEKAQKELTEAISQASVGNVASSVNEIESLIEKYPTWIQPRHQLSQLYFEMGKRQDAILVMEGAIAIDTNSQIQQLYSLARMYEGEGNYSKAESTYKSVMRLGKGMNQAKLSEENLSKLATKKKLYQNHYEINVTAITDGINSASNEVLGRWTLDGRSLIFTRMVSDQEDLYIANFDTIGNLLSVDPFSFNTSLNEGGHAISPDGKYLIFTSCNRNDGLGSCDLYLAVLKDNVWQKPVNMGPSFNSISWDSQPCFGLDGKSIFFSSARTGGFGGRDIWMVKELSSGKWSAPINLGPSINTANNEASPFIHFDGRTMYFMRDGKEGLGENDLFIARQGIDLQWQQAQNMGSPISTSADEGALSIHPDGKTALITRVTRERKNDLFEFVLPKDFLATPVQAVTVHVSDAISNKPLRARIEILDLQGKDTIRISQRADEKGLISITLDRNRTYGLIAIQDGYILQSLNLEADSNATRNMDVRMTPIVSALEKTFVLQNIFFQSGSSVLLSSSYPELKKLIQILSENTGMNIEIQGHTDNVSSETSNQQLSEARARSVYQYLMDAGINSERLSFVGLGETQPIAPNETESGRKQNRRTEFRILNL